nr:hypothetcal protein [Klebsiella pneumoniae]
MHVQKHWLFSKTVNEVPRTGKRSNLINFLFCLDLKKNNVTILVIKTVCAGRPVEIKG